VGLGAPIYSKLDTDIAAALMSINAVKGVNIGSGMNSAYLSGEENSDEMRMSSGKLKFKSNNAGGILGGISSGQNIVASFSVKPTSSILSNRETIDKKGKNSNISVKGRHDPCVGIRAVPIGEAMLSCVLLDHFLMIIAQFGYLEILFLFFAKTILDFRTFSIFSTIELQSKPAFLYIKSGVS
jgi:chorismate synthase